MISEITISIITQTNICSINFALFKTFVRDAERLGLC